MKLREIIKQYRLDHSLTLRDFASKCGMSHSYIAMLEDGKNSKTGQPMMPTFSTLQKIAQALDLTVGELIRKSEDLPFAIDESLASEFDYRQYMKNQAKLKGVDISKLFETIDNPQSLLGPGTKITEGERMLLEVFRLVPEDQQKHVIEIIRASLKMQGLLK